MSSREGRRVAALAAILLLFTCLSPPASPAGATHSLTGKVLTPDGLTPVPGAVVVFRERGSGLTYTSEPAEGDGTYRVSSLPDGEYFLTIRTDAGFFDLPKAITIKGGQPTSLTVVLSGTPSARAGKQISLGRRGRGKLTAAILSAVGAAAVIGLAASGGDSGDEEGSPHKP